MSETELVQLRLAHTAVTRALEQSGAYGRWAEQEIAQLRDQVAELARERDDAEGERDRMHQALREAGIDYPLGPQGIRDLAAMASGRLEDLNALRDQLAEVAGVGLDTRLQELAAEAYELGVHLASARKERDELRQHVLDIAAHATPYGDIPDEPGWVGTYLLTAGALHRALGKIGHTAPKCQAEARLAELEALVDVDMEKAWRQELARVEMMANQRGRIQDLCHRTSTHIFGMAHMGLPEGHYVLAADILAALADDPSPKTCGRAQVEGWCPDHGYARFSATRCAFAIPATAASSGTRPEAAALDALSTAEREGREASDG